MDNAGAEFTMPTSSSDRLIAIVEDDAGLAGMFRDILGCFGNLRLQNGASLFKILGGHSNTKNTPIIVITGSHDWELHRMGLQTGLLLRKPFEIEELLHMIQALLPFQEM